MCPSLAKPDPLGSASHLRQRLLQIRQQVRRVLDARRITDEAVRHAELQPIGLRHVPEGHRDRQLDQALDATEARGLVRDRVASMKRMAPARSVSISKVTTPPKPFIMRSAIAWSGWLARPGIPDVFDLGMGLELAGEGHAVRVVALHPDVEGLDAAQQEPGGVAVDDAAEDAERLAHGSIISSGPSAPGEQVVVPAKVFRRAVEDEVGAVGERLWLTGDAKVESMMTLTPRAWPTREVGDVDHAQVGIGRALGEEELRVGTDRGFEGGCVFAGSITVVSTPSARGIDG